MKDISNLIKVITNKRVIWFIYGWLSAFIVAGIAYLFIHSRLFLDHFDAWIQTFGTLVGSFAGAGLTGLLALNAVKFQIDKQDNLDRHKETNNLIKGLTFFRLNIDALLTTHNMLYNQVLSFDPKWKETQKTYNVHDLKSREKFVNYFLGSVEIIITKLSNYDISLMPINYFIELDGLKESLNGLKKRISDLQLSCADDDMDLYKLGYDLLCGNINDLNNISINIQKEINKLY